MEILNELSENLNTFLLGMGILAPLFSSLFIVIEGTLAFLPLFVFVTINIMTMGSILGCLVSWICTTVGSYIAFSLFRNGLSKHFQKKIANKKKVIKFMKLIDNLKFKQLVLIISIPFAPSFFINMGAGLSHISKKKYLYSLLVGKVFVILFSGFLGVNMIECLTNPLALVKVVAMLAVAYILASIVNKKFDLDERFDDK
jgi:uncharacterized membrane protein YdjX (TVP38/TMEM64 family)